jgi:hypothetical protein
MLTGPKIKLAVDIHKLDGYFQLGSEMQEGFGYDWVIDRAVYDEIASLLKEYKITEDYMVREFCFILLWVEKEIMSGDEQGGAPGKYDRMWAEIGGLKEYLLHHRVTSVTFHGETERNTPGKDISLKEDINIDRLCDGIRSVFREEFEYDKLKRRSKGQRAWQRRKMTKMRNNFLNYFTSDPRLDELTLEEQNYLIDRFSALAGLPE